MTKQIYTPGDKVECNGYPGTVVQYPYNDCSMVEVKLARGLTCVADVDLIPTARLDTITLAGRTYETRSFASDAGANAWLDNNPKWGVLAEFEGRVHCAGMLDRGTPVPNWSPRPIQ